MSKLKMVMKNGQMVPFYAADGKGKMGMGGSNPMEVLRLKDESRRFAMQGKEMGPSDKSLMARNGIESYQIEGETPATIGSPKIDKYTESKMNEWDNMNLRNKYDYVTGAGSAKFAAPYFEGQNVEGTKRRVIDAFNKLSR